MSEPEATYTVHEQLRDGLPVLICDELPARLRDYLQERRRSLITELRQIESLLNLPQSIPPRQRPH